MFSQSLLPHQPHLAFPDVAPTHIKQPHQAVELDVEAGNLRVAQALGGADDGDAAARLLGGAKGGVPPEGDGLAVDGVDGVDDDGEGRVGGLGLHEDLLGGEGGLAEGAEDEGVDAVGAVDELVGAVLGADLVGVFRDELSVDLDGGFGFVTGQALGVLAAEEGAERGEGQGRAGEGGGGEEGVTHLGLFGFVGDDFLLLRVMRSVTSIFLSSTFHHH